MIPVRLQKDQRLHEIGLPVSCNRRHHQLIRCFLSLASIAIPFFNLARQGAISNYLIIITAGICGIRSSSLKANSSQCRYA
jgi:hypothetical protein